MEVTGRHFCHIFCVTGEQAEHQKEEIPNNSRTDLNKPSTSIVLDAGLFR